MSLGDLILIVNDDDYLTLDLKIDEQTLAQQVSQSSMDWVFRKKKSMGRLLWHYGELPEAVKATMEGLPDIVAVAASGVAMTAVAASKIARDAILASPVALDAIYASAIAIGKFAAGVAGLDPALYDDIAAVTQSSAAMEAVTASTIAMEAVANSKIARDAVFAKAAALAKVRGSSMAIAKFAIGCAGRNPANYSNIAAVVSDTAAMTAIAGSSTAMSAIAGSTVAMDALYARKQTLSGASAARSGKMIILQISTNNSFNIASNYGYATLSDGSQPNWSNYRGKYAYFKAYSKYATYIKNDTEADDWIEYFAIS